MAYSSVKNFTLKYLDCWQFWSKLIFSSSLIFFSLSNLSSSELTQVILSYKAIYDWT